MAAIKYEPNPEAKKQIQDRVEGYFIRAEELKKVVEDQANSQKGGSGGTTATQERPPDEDSKEDKEKERMRGNLSSSIVSEKPKYVFSLNFPFSLKQWAFNALSFKSLRKPSKNSICILSSQSSYSNDLFRSP
jgi:hypothetical protein